MRAPAAVRREQLGRREDARDGLEAELVGPLDHLDAEAGADDEPRPGGGAPADLRARDDRPDTHRAPVPGGQLDGRERTQGCRS